MDSAADAATAERIASFVARLSQRLDAHVRDVADSLGITPGQVTALRELSEPLTLAELATRMACERPNATYIADRMEAQQLIERRPNPSDRRSKMVVLTEAGEQCRSNVLAALAVDSPIATMNERDRDHLATALSRAVGDSAIAPTAE